MKLYDITKNMQAIEQMMADGVDPSELKDALGDIEEAFQAKGEHILYLMQNMASDVEALKTEEARLAKRRKVTENQMSGIKEYLIQNMMESGISKLDNGVIKASIIKPRPMLLISDDDRIPTFYKKVTVSSAIDKKLLLADLKGGEAIGGCEIGFSKTGLSIK